MGAKLDIITNLQTYKTYKLIYAQLQIYLLNFTLSILIAIFSCQIPTTYAMFYKKVSCVLIQYGQLYVPYGMMHRAGFSKIAPRPLGHFLQKPKMATLSGIADSKNRPG